MKPPHSRSSPSTTPEDREAKRLRILEAAAREFAQFGFDTASIESIASRAGIGKGTIYNYTGSKDHLFSECLQLFCDELHQLLEEIAGPLMEEAVHANIELPPSHGFGLLGERLADLVHRRNDFVTMYFESIFGVTPRGRDLVLSSAREFIAGLEQLFATGQRHGFVRGDAPADMIASLVFLNRLAYSRMLDGLGLGNHSHTEHAEFLFQMHWHGMKAEAAP